jgi:hypothetical protein
MNLVLFKTELTTDVLKFLIFKFIVEIQQRRTVEATHFIKFVNKQRQIKEGRPASKLKTSYVYSWIGTRKRKLSLGRL